VQGREDKIIKEVIVSEKKELTKTQLLNRQRFFDAAELLFERYGFQKVTIEDVCKAAGMSKPTFYSLFKDKEDLFVRMIIQICETTVEKWESELPEKINPTGKLLSFIDFNADLIKVKPIFISIYKDTSMMEKLTRILYNTRHSPILSSLRRILKDGMKSGHFRRFDPDAVLWMIYTILDSMYIMIPMMTNQPGAGENPKLAREVKQFILRGIGVENVGK